MKVSAMEVNRGVCQGETMLELHDFFIAVCRLALGVLGVLDYLLGLSGERFGVSMCALFRVMRARYAEALVVCRI